ncbi:MAG: hypothetical protein AAF545_05910 [Pseudomonadota bacterium]
MVRRVENNDSSGFFFCYALGVLAVGLAGFGPGFVVALSHGLSGIPGYVHLHAILMVGWLLLLSTQAFLVWRNRVSSHRKLGIFSAMVFALAYITMWMLTLNNLVKPVPEFVDVALEKIFALQVRSLLLLPLLFGFALDSASRDTGTHRRLIALISALIVEAAIVRMNWLPGVDGLRTELSTITLYSLLFLIPMIVFDLISRGRLHRATLLILVIAGASKAFAFWAWSSPTWLRFTGGIERYLEATWPL